MEKIRINLVNPQELLAIPGVDQVKADLILRHRVEHGPISNPAGLTTVLGLGLASTALDRNRLRPAHDSATESAGG
jgi:DNA uptake protein ComE-like DNA-binding protein